MFAGIRWLDYYDDEIRNLYKVLKANKIEYIEIERDEGGGIIAYDDDENEWETSTELYDFIWNEVIVDDEFMIEKLGIEEYSMFVKNYYYIQKNKELIEKKKCDTYIKKIKNEELWLAYIPTKYRTYEVCLEAIKDSKYSATFSWVPEHLKTYGMCKIAVSLNGSDLLYVPKEHKTKEMCEIAVRKTGWALDSVPKELITYDLCLEAVTNCSESLRFVPMEFITTELCDIAVKDNASNVRYVPSSFLTDKMCLDGVKKDAYNLKEIPNEFRTYEVCLEAMKNNGGFYLKFVPKELKTLELCEIAVKDWEESIDYVPFDISKDLFKKENKIDLKDRINKVNSTDINSKDTKSIEKER